MSDDRRVGAETTASTIRNPRRGPIALSMIAFAIAVLLPTLRLSHHMNVPGKKVDPGQWALVDFRDNIYYPVRAFLDGRNPYDRQTHLATYPVRVRFPPYTPLFLLLHAPLGLLPHVASQLVYFVLTIGLTLALALFTLKICGKDPTAEAVFGIAALVLLSRPGHWNLMLGQATLEFVIVVYAALYSGERSPSASGLAFAIATMKATVALPLALLMLCLRYRRSLVIGTSIAVLSTIPPTLALINSAGGGGVLWGTFMDTVRVFEQDESANAVVSSSRIDAVAFLSMLQGQPLGPLAQLGVLGLVIGSAYMAIRRTRRFVRGRESDLYCFAIATLAILIPLYHQVYGALLLVLPLTALVLDRWAPVEFSPPRAIRWALITLLAVPAVNQLVAFRVLQYLKTEPFLWASAISFNRVALILAFVLYIVVAFKRVTPVARLAESTT